ncbi:DinB family protein [uncultured Pseudoteredinibacter sp.]|uniref:DinB family protein n=1 Tax=uncultured Pseudoteredinibacter sp. TaxID=1641701 RepID=UPI0026213407|nr:DinB family protein [uncultured Pseudoteredinibacter sp.]
MQQKRLSGLMIDYKAWADKRILETLSDLPDELLAQQQKIIFGSILNTMNHIYRIDLIWKGHLESKPNSFRSKTPSCPAGISTLLAEMSELNQWFCNHEENLSDKQLREVLEFSFINGEKSAMTRETMLLHVSNHSTYHRGHIADMLYNLGEKPPVTDLPVYIQSSQ